MIRPCNEEDRLPAAHLLKTSLPNYVNVKLWLDLEVRSNLNNITPSTRRVFITMTPAKLSVQLIKYDDVSTTARRQDGESRNRKVYENNTRLKVSGI